MKKMVFCHDFLFHDASNKGTYHVWLFDLFKPLFEECGIMEFCEIKNLKNSQGKLFSRTHFFKLSGIENAENAYFSYDISKISKASIDYLKTFFNKDVFVFGVELGMDLRKILSEQNCTFLNLWIHSFKLFDDVLLMFNTNSKAIYENLEKYKVSYEKMRFNANYYKIYMRENKFINDSSLMYNSVLFIGQTPIDQSVRKDSKYYNITDFKQKMAELSKQYKHIYYQEHPLLKSYSSLSKGYEIIQKINKYIDSTPYISKINFDISTYALLASEKISKVVALSSSVLYEAQFFGKSTEYLLRPLFDIDTQFGLNTFISVYESCFNPTFWKDVLSSEFTKLKTVPNEIYFSDTKNKLRDLKNLYWGYKNFDLLVKTAEKVAQMEKNVGLKRYNLLDNIKKCYAKFVKINLLNKLHLSVPFGKEIRFCDKFEHLISLHGFSKKESWGVWSCEEQAFLKFRVPFGRKKYKLILKFKPWINVHHRSFKIQILVNKKKVSEQAFEFGKTSIPTSFEIPLNGLKKRKVYVDFNFEGLASPKDLGVNDDVRKLGFGLISMKLEKDK